MHAGSIRGHRSLPCRPFKTSGNVCAANIAQHARGCASSCYGGGNCIRCVDRGDQAGPVSCCRKPGVLVTSVFTAFLECPEIYNQELQLRHAILIIVGKPDARTVLPCGAVSCCAIGVNRAGGATREVKQSLLNGLCRSQP